MWKKWYQVCISIYICFIWVYMYQVYVYRVLYVLYGFIWQLEWFYMSLILQTVWGIILDRIDLTKKNLEMSTNIWERPFSSFRLQSRDHYLVESLEEFSSIFRNAEKHKGLFSPAPDVLSTDAFCNWFSKNKILQIAGGLLLSFTILCAFKICFLKNPQEQNCLSFFYVLFCSILSLNFLPTRS